MQKFYSQHGEDFLTNEIFQHKKTGFFVEIGCLDGIEFSNTYFFEKQGWKGICVEAHKDFVELLKENRKGSYVVHCAVGERNEEDVIFYANKIGSLSTLDKKEEKRWEENYREFFTGFEEQHVKMRTLTSIFDEAGVDEIDFISLDIEGYEVMALSGLDLSKYRPHLFIIEYKDDVHKNGLESILFPKGYMYIGKRGCNLFYGTEISDRKVLRRNYGKQVLVSFDKNGAEQCNEVSLDHPYFFEKVLFKIRAVKNGFCNIFKKAKK